ncbi:hypothetical protein ACW9FB_11825 [Ralstonia mannitolilytica]
MSLGEETFALHLRAAGIDGFEREYRFTLLAQAVNGTEEDAARRLAVGLRDLRRGHANEGDFAHAVTSMPARQRAALIRLRAATQANPARAPLAAHFQCPQEQPRIGVAHDADLVLLLRTLFCVHHTIPFFFNHSTRASACCSMAGAKSLHCFLSSAL